MKNFVFIYIVVISIGVLFAGTIKRDVSEKTKDDEDVYGDLDENDGEIQKDQVNYYDEVVDEGKGDEEGPAETGVINEANVKLISKSETFVQVIGDVVHLPCQASTKEDLVRVWNKNSMPIYQGNINIGNKQNYKLYSNGTLEVTLKSDDDFGSYSCLLALSNTMQPEIVHQIVQQTSPKITALYASGNKKVFDIGDVLTLTCEATGHPKPKIQWYKSNDHLGTDGETLTIQNVKPKHAGTYRCLADNSVGRPAHNHTEIFVNHKPVVSIEKYIVNSDHGSDTELVCEVRAYPTASVVWQKNGENIVSNEPKITLKREKNNEKNILIIKNVEEADFGQYSCVAVNGFGKEMRNLSLVKTPAKPKLERNPSNDSTKDVILQWRVESKQPISAHELQYRKKGEKTWKTITPEVSNSENDVYLIKQILKNLEPGEYESRARSKNSHGWSDFSEISPFEGVLVKHGSHHPKPKHTKKEQKDNKTRDSSIDMPAQHRSVEITSLGESTSSGLMLVSSTVLVICALLAIQIRQ